MPIEVNDGFHKPTRTTITCIECDGKKVLPKGYRAAQEKAEKEFWCQCPADSVPIESIIFHDNGECAMCEKHHYHCPDCGKITQVG